MVALALVRWPRAPGSPNNPGVPPFCKRCSKAFAWFCVNKPFVTAWLIASFSASEAACFALSAVVPSLCANACQNKSDSVCCVDDDDDEDDDEDDEDEDEDEDDAPEDGVVVPDGAVGVVVGPCASTIVPPIPAASRARTRIPAPIQTNLLFTNIPFSSVFLAERNFFQNLKLATKTIVPV
jgi:hypothetical protein